MNFYSLPFIDPVVCHSERSEESPVVIKVFRRQCMNLNRITERSSE